MAHPVLQTYIAQDPNVDQFYLRGDGTNASSVYNFSSYQPQVINCFHIHRSGCSMVLAPDYAKHGLCSDVAASRASSSWYSPSTWHSAGTMLYEQQVSTATRSRSRISLKLTHWLMGIANDNGKIPHDYCSQRLCVWF